MLGRDPQIEPSAATVQQGMVIERIETADQFCAQVQQSLKLIMLPGHYLPHTLICGRTRGTGQEKV